MNEPKVQLPIRVCVSVDLSTQRSVLLVWSGVTCHATQMSEFAAQNAQQSAGVAFMTDFAYCPTAQTPDVMFVGHVAPANARKMRRKTRLILKVWMKAEDWSVPSYVV